MLRGGVKINGCSLTLSDSTYFDLIVSHLLWTSDHWLIDLVTGQLADKPTRGQSSRGLDNSRTGQLAEMFALQFGVYNSSKCYFGQITLFIRCQYSIGLELGLGLFNVQIK